MAMSHQNAFIQGLNPLEIKIIERHLNRSSDRKDSKELKLFKTFISFPDKTFSDPELETLTGSKGPALRTLKSRLFDKATEALTHTSFIQDVKLFDERDRIAFKLKKQLLIYKILYQTSRKENTKILLELLNQTIVVAKRYALYDLLVEALHAKKYSYGIRTGIKEFNKLQNEIEFFEYCRKAVIYATDCLHEMTIYLDLPESSSPKSVKNLISKSILQMEIDYRKTRSPLINNYLFFFKIANAEEKNDYITAINYCKNYIAFIKSNKIVFTRARIGSAYNQLSLYYLFLNKYSEARDCQKLSLKFHVENSFNYYMSVEHSFFIDFYDHKYDAAMLILKKLLKQFSDAGEFRKSRYVFYIAYTLFAKKQYKEALTLLNTSFEIERDKTLWSVALKILIIQTYIELQKFDEASRTLESLRKHVERHGKGGKIKQRDLLIIKALKEYEKEGFNYSLNNKVLPKILKELTQKNKPISWQYKTPEMMPFHEWLEGK